MVIDQEIQSGITVVNQPRLVRDSAGKLYTVYVKSATNLLNIAYSTDGGLTWTEVEQGGQTVVSPAIAVNGTDTIYIIYRKTTANSGDIECRQFTISGGWTSAETVGVSYYGTADDIGITVDSSDNVHVSYENLGAVNAGTVYYNKRTSGTWGTALKVYDPATINYPTGHTKIAIDSNNYIYIIWLDNEATIKYVKYTSFWTAAVQIGAISVDVGSFPSLTIDSSDNVHVVYANNAQTVLKYIKYTSATDTWAGEVTITTISSGGGLPTICVDMNDNLDVVYYKAGDIYFIQNTGSWGSDSKILDASGSDSFGRPQIQSTIYPILNGVSTNIATAGYQFTYINTVAGVNILRYYASDGFAAPIETKNYSREAHASLPATDSNLSNLFTSAEYADVATVNNIFATQTATDEYSIMEFKNKGNNSSDNIVVTWIGQSNIAPTTSTVYLQIYNRNSTTWETLDSNSSAGANANFSLSGTKTSSLSNYYDGSNWVSCRVYQNAI